MSRALRITFWNGVNRILVSHKYASYIRRGGAPLSKDLAHKKRSVVPSQISWSIYSKSTQTERLYILFSTVQHHMDGHISTTFLMESVSAVDGGGGG